MKQDPKQRKHQKRHYNTFKKHVKHYNDRKNRSATRQAIDAGDFESLSRFDQAKREDVWSWD